MEWFVPVDQTSKARITVEPFLKSESELGIAPPVGATSTSSITHGDKPLSVLKDALPNIFTVLLTAAFKVLAS